MKSSENQLTDRMNVNYADVQTQACPSVLTRFHGVSNLMPRKEVKL
ncbi:MAG: hypothetical protein PHE09_03300 [Oscillospiraceae bacterium]|nr:hypothetical protein [Oscillospiraceae bacterium]